MPRRTFANPVTHQIFSTIDPAYVPPAGFVQTPEPDGAIPRPQQEYVSGYSGDRLGGGGNPADVIPNLKFNPNEKYWGPNV